MNGSVVVISILIAILLILLLTLGGVEFLKNRNNSSLVIIESCDKFINKSNLLVLTNENSRSCSNNSSFYVPSFNFVVAPYPVSASTTCIQYCDTLTGSTCISSTNPNAQTDYNNCLAFLTNPECEGPLPIAISQEEGILYYAVSPTDRTCLSLFS